MASRREDPAEEPAGLGNPAWGEQYQPKRRRGRPPGARNRPKDAVMTQDRLEKLYQRIEPILTSEHKQYLNEILKGQKGVDPLREADLLTRYFTIMATEAMEYALVEKRFSRDVASIMAEARMMVRDLDEMKRKAREEEEKRRAQEAYGQGVVDPTRESALGRFASLRGESPRS